MIVLYIIVGILALIALLLLIKVKVELDFVLDGLSFEWNGTLTLFGGTVKVNLKKPADKIEKEVSQDVDVDKPEKSLDFLREMLENTKTVIKYFKKKLTIEEFSTEMRIGLPDPMYTAILYGACSSFGTGLYHLLNENVRLRDWRLDSLPDFENAKIYAKHRSAYSIRPLQILIVAINIFIHEKPIRNAVLAMEKH